MRIAYLVDVHGHFDAVERAVRETGPVDAVVVGGDLTNAGDPDSVERAVESWRALAPTLLVVAGNMDDPSFDRLFDSLGVGINGRGMLFRDVGLFGRVGISLHTHAHPV